MMLWSGPTLPLIALVWPLVLGALCLIPALRRHALRVLPVAPLPALVLALGGATGVTEAPVLLLGVVLTGGPEAMLLLAMTAALWTAAGIFAQGMACGHAQTGGVRGFLVPDARWKSRRVPGADVITFYVAFARCRWPPMCW
jgi:hydrogenase-4 component B